MKKEVFETKVKPILTYVGAIGAILTSCAYIILMIVLIKGFHYEQTQQAVLFAIVNAVVGLIIANFLKYQGLTFAKELPENQEIVAAYYSTKTKDKKPHSLQFFWITSIVKDVFTKGCTVAFSTAGLIYIVIVGSNDWNLMLMALVNLILFICFGLIALNKGYDYYNNTYVNYMKEKIDEAADKEAMDKGKELLDTDLERVEGLENVNPLHHSEHSA